MDAANAMPAPQAALTSQIAAGIVHGTLPWRMVLVGAALGAVLVAVEAWLRRRGLTFPALTVGIGMYLPLSVEMTIAVGGVLGWLAERRLRRCAEAQGEARGEEQGDDADKATEVARRRGVLLASGFLVGESFVGVILAVADTLAGRSASLALVGPDFAPYATWMGLAVFTGGLAVFYRLTARAEPDEAAA